MGGHQISTWIRVPHKFRVGDKVWLHLYKEYLLRSHWKFPPTLHYDIGLTPTQRLWVKMLLNKKNSLFFGLNLILNVELLQPYFPPLIGTSCSYFGAHVSLGAIFNKTFPT